MGVWSFLCYSLLLSALAATTSLAQDLARRLADRFAEGVDALKTHDLDRAERVFRDVLAAGGNRAFVHHNLGIVLQQRGGTLRRSSNSVPQFALDFAFGPRTSWPAAV